MFVKLVRDFVWKHFWLCCSQWNR